jgi:broad specificity phosphatase PhoE
VLILVRHGQTDANAEGRLLGRMESPLSDLGRRQAAAVVEAVQRAGARPARVVSSPLARARETAAVFGLPVEIDERWVELDYGAYDGDLLADVPAELWAAWRADPAFAPPNGESMAALGLRVRDACAELARSGSADDVVVVSHVSPIKAAVAWALGVEDGIAWRMRLDTASICRVATGAPGPTLLTFNEVAHLNGLQAVMP